MRKLLISLSLTVAAILVLSFLGVLWVLPKLTSMENQRVFAAESALDHSPMTHVLDVRFFTGGPLETAVYGTDALHRPLYVIIAGTTLRVIYVDQAISASTAIARAQNLAGRGAAVVSAVPGVITDASSATLRRAGVGTPVWDVALRTRSGAYAFAMMDLTSGKLLDHFSSAVTQSVYYP